LPELLVVSYCGGLADLILTGDGLGTYICVDALLSAPEIIESILNYRIRRACLSVGGQRASAVVMVRAGGACSLACVVISGLSLDLESVAEAKDELLKAVHELVMSVGRGMPSG